LRLLKTRATRIKRLQAQLDDAESRATNFRTAAFRSQLTLLRQQQVMEAEEAHRWVNWQ
jgi:hypothetical protein